MDTNTIKYLIKTVQSGSINKAAQTLYMNHQHLGKKLSQLEDELEIEILKRTKTGIELTEDGKLIYEKLLEIDKISQEIDGYVNFVQKKQPEKSEAFRTVSVYLTSSIFPKKASKSILKLEENFPNTKIEVEESGYQNALKQIYEKENSFANIVIPEKELNNIPNDLMIFFKREYELAAYIPKNMLNLKMMTVPLEITNFLQLPIIFYSAYSVLENIIWQVLNEHGVPNVRHITSNHTNFCDLMYSQKYVTAGWYKDSTRYYEGDEFSKFMLNGQDISVIPLVHKQKKINVISIWVCRKDTILLDEAKYFMTTL